MLGIRFGEPRLRETDAVFSPTLAFVGIGYGMIVAASFVAGAMSGRWNRLAVRTLVVLTGVAVLAGIANPTGGFPSQLWLRYLVHAGGMAIVQPWLPRLIGLPRPVKDLEAGSEQRPLAIADLVITTTATAVVLAAALRYRAVHQGELFWGVTIGLWFAFPATSTALYAALYSRPASRALIWTLVTGSLVLLSSGLLSAANTWVVADRLAIDPRALRDYLTLHGGFLLGAGWGGVGRSGRTGGQSV